MDIISATGGIMKKKLIIIGIDMRLAGTEKSLFGYLHRYDPQNYDITLLLAKKQGTLLKYLPEHIKVIEMPNANGKLFLLNKRNAFSSIISSHIIIHHPIKAFKAIIMYAKEKRAKTSDTMKLWCDLMCLLPNHPGVYDEAMAYWGEKTMFFMLQKVNAKVKIVRQHFSYTNTKNANALYYEAYKKCDRIEHVARDINKEFIELFPDLSQKAAYVPNVIIPDEVKRLASQARGFSDQFGGIRLLTIARLSPQKGLDNAAIAIKRLSKLTSIRWYIIGDGEESENLRKFIFANSLEERIILLGEKSNPYPYLNECDIYLQPSRYEGKPLTVEEAMILEKPIVACNYLTAYEQLDGYEQSIICQCNEISICDAILTLLRRINTSTII